MTNHIERIRIDAPERHGPELEEARHLAERRGFTADLDYFNGDARLSLASQASSGGTAHEDDEYLDLLVQVGLPDCTVDVYISRAVELLGDAGDLDRGFAERGLYAEFWAA